MEKVHASVRPAQRSMTSRATSQQSALAAFLRRVLLHSSLTDEERRSVLALSGEVNPVLPRRDLVHPGQRVHHSILVAEGFLGRYDLMRDGARQITAVHIPGDMCDLHSVVAPRTGWGITALSPSVVLQIPHGELRRLAVRYPNLALAFWRDTTVDGSILAKAVANLGRQDARARIAHLLCEMAIRMLRAGLGDGLSYALPLSQEQIGDIVGLTSVHVNRTLQALRAEGLFSLKGQMVEILDWDRLARVAGFTPTYLLPVES